MVKRLFTFGCSYTRYDWPTWADFIQFNYDEFQNWASPGSDNYLIFHSIIEAHNRHKFTANDTVIIMWTMPMRISYLKDNYEWQKEGMWSAPIIEFFQNMLSEKNQVLQLLDYSQMALAFLDSLGVTYKMINMKHTFYKNEEFNEDDLYANYPAFKIYEKVFDSEKWVIPTLAAWNKFHPEPPKYYPAWNKFAGEVDKHPSAKTHFTWVESILGPVLEIEMPEEAFRLLRNWKGENYPTKEVTRIGRLF